MKSWSSILKIAVVPFFVLAGFATDLLAQEARTEATVAYNNARELAQQEDFDNAIGLYQEALEISNSSACEDCGDIVELVENQLPRVYFTRATNGFQTFRSEGTTEAADASIELFREAAEIAQQYGDEQVQQRATAIIPQIYYNKSLVEYNQEDYGAANESLDTALELNSNYTLAYYQKALVRNAEGAGVDEVVSLLDQAIEVGQRVGDSQNVSRATQRAGEELIYEAVLNKDEQRFSEALGLLQRAEEYLSNNSDLHYRFAEVYNGLGQPGNAIEHANRALETASGGVTDQAKIHFELGLAHKALEQVNEACGAFENAAYGDFRDPALHELEYELECEGYAANN